MFSLLRASNASRDTQAGGTAAAGARTPSPGTGSSLRSHEEIPSLRVRSWTNMPGVAGTPRRLLRSNPEPHVPVLTAGKTSNQQPKQNFCLLSKAFTACRVPAGRTAAARSSPLPQTARCGTNRPGSTAAATPGRAKPFANAHQPSSGKLPGAPAPLVTVSGRGEARAETSTLVPTGQPCGTAVPRDPCPSPSHPPEMEDAKKWLLPEPLDQPTLPAAPPKP